MWSPRAPTLGPAAPAHGPAAVAAAVADADAVHERDGVARAVRGFPADTAAESAHVHARGAVASEEAIGFARNQASHLLRIGLEHRAAARRRGAPLRPIATDRHTLAMAELAKGGEGSEKAALGCLCISDATVLDDGCFASAAGALLVGTAFCVAATDQVGAGARVAVCCGTCHRAHRAIRKLARI